MPASEPGKRFPEYLQVGAFWAARFRNLEGARSHLFLVPLPADNQRVIIGRTAQIDELTTLLKGAAAQRGGTVVLRGEAGIGKSALLHHAAEQARTAGSRVLTAAGVQAEVRIPYAGLHHLLRPLGIGMDDDASPYRIAVDVLGLIGAMDEPVLLAVEDAHWLDRASWETLTFLGRRLESDRVAMIMTARDGEDVDRRLTGAGLPEIRLEPLEPEDAAALLDRTVPSLRPALRELVLEAAAGNPLGLVELGEAAGRSGAGALLPTSVPLSTRVERTFSALVAELPPATRALLLVAALDDGDALGEMTEAATLAEGHPITSADIEPAVMTRLVAVDSHYRLRFRHPLLRSALSQTAGAADRGRIHTALASVLAGTPDRRLWHRAAAATGPDETLARELADTAIRARNQHSAAVALAAFERSAQLSEDPRERGARLIWAASTADEQGDPETVRRLLAQIVPADLDPMNQAWLAWLNEVHLGTGWSGNQRLGTYIDTLESMVAAADPEFILTAMLNVAVRVHWSEPDASLRRRFIDVAEALDLPPDHPRLVSVLATIAPIERGAICLERTGHLRRRLDLTPNELFEVAFGATSLGAFELSNSLLATAVVRLRAQGRLGLLAQALVNLGFNALGLGDVRAALPAAAESVALAAETGLHAWALTGRLNLGAAEALRGNATEAVAIADWAETVLTAQGMHPMLALVQRVRGLEALADGRLEEAFRQLRRVFDPVDPAYHLYFRFLLIGHLAEAAVSGGARDELRLLVAELEPLADATRSPALIAGLIYARAVLADDDAGFEAALAADLTAWPFERARIQLTYGGWLRRQRRPADSRPHLRSAAATFDGLGATPWADRARAELRASGESLRKPVDAAAELTPQEQQIARLAAEGLSNREIAERLFLSPRTISTHLYRIYPKIGIKSRGELARVLPIK